MLFFFSKKINGFNFYAPSAVQDDNIIVISVTLIFSLILPSFFVLILKKGKYIESYHMKNREERLLPFTLMSISMVCAYYLLFSFYEVEVEPIIMFFYVGCLLSIILALAITFTWKISIHMIGIGGFTGAVFLLNYLSKSNNITMLVSVILISGVVAYSRLTLKAHTIKQVVAGYVLGFACESFVLILI